MRGAAYEIIRSYIAQGAKPTAADEPQITGLQVSPPDAVLKPGEQIVVSLDRTEVREGAHVRVEAETTP